MTLTMCPHCLKTVENVVPCPECGRAAGVTYIPGDGFGVDPIIARGEELERLLQQAATPSMYASMRDELDSIKAYAHAKLKHTTQYPLANTSQEESAADLAEEQARSANEREAALHAAWQVAKPMLWEAFKLGFGALKK